MLRASGGGHRGRAAGGDGSGGGVGGGDSEFVSAEGVRCEEGR